MELFTTIICWKSVGVALDWLFVRVTAKYAIVEMVDTVDMVVEIVVERVVDTVVETVVESVVETVELIVDSVVETVVVVDTVGTALNEVYLAVI